MPELQRTCVDVFVRISWEEVRSYVQPAFEVEDAEEKMEAKLCGHVEQARGCYIREIALFRRL